MDNEIITRCGYRCDLCLAFRDNIQKDDQRALLSKGWNKIFGIKLRPEDIYCDGCLSCKEDLKLIDSGCKVRPCVISRGFENCSECDEFPCAILEERLVRYTELEAGLDFSISRNERKKFIEPYENYERLVKLREKKSPNSRVYNLNDELIFTERNEFRKWLIENHPVSKGIWIIFSKTNKLRLLKPDEALEEALCFGWIDGQMISLNEEQYKKKFTPRRKGSHWSDKNKELTHKLIEHGLMTEHGIYAIEQAKKNGTWKAPKGEPITDDQINNLLSVLAGVEPALTNFLKMSPSVKRTYTALYLDAKKEDTRIKRLAKIIERLNENKKPM